jgi:hypothetical protein
VTAIKATSVYTASHERQADVAVVLPAKSDTRGQRMRSARCHQPGRDSRARASPEPVIQQTPYAKHRPADRLIDLLTACRVAAEPDTLNGRWPLTGVTGVPCRGPLQSPCELRAGVFRASACRRAAVPWQEGADAQGFALVLRDRLKGRAIRRFSLHASRSGPSN